MIVNGQVIYIKLLLKLMRFGVCVAFARIKIKYCCQLLSFGILAIYFNHHWVGVH